MVDIIKGRIVNRICSECGATARAVFAADLVSGQIELVRPTQAQAAQLFGVSLSYVGAAVRATPDQRAQIERGSLSLA
jgi:hypothetical protein